MGDTPNQTVQSNVKTNVQRLTSMFIGHSASGSGPTPMELGSTTPTGSKRGRLEGDSATTTFTKLDLFDLLDEQGANYQKSTEVSIAKALDTFGIQFRSDSKSDTKELLGKYHDKLSGRFVAVETRVDKVEATVSGLSTDLSAMQSSIVEIQKEQARQAEALLLANRSGVLTWSDLQSDEFDRPSNIEVIRVSSPKYVSKTSVENALSPFLSDLGYPNDIWSVTGNEGGKEFFVQFQQNALTSAKNVKHVLQNLKVNGKYKIFNAETVKIDSTTGKPQTAKLFVSGDQNPKQKAVRYMCVKFTEACKTLYPSMEWSYYDGVVQFTVEDEKDRQGLAIMLPTKSSVDRSMVQWDNILVNKYELDKTKIFDLFDKLSSGPAAAKEWCV